MLENELAHECGSDQHPMVGQKVEAVACCGTCDDVLFKLLDRQGWAIVHLTWRRETNPSWPACDVMENWSDVIDEMTDRGHWQPVWKTAVRDHVTCCGAGHAADRVLRGSV
ncbi:hypothetical protein [Planomonospora venezuelensis]|uniref:Uncharacterized protein n=1 Tax=Planomonospora venezuelensis TaxID=1999 RepID=A0A841D508_PLAVE|nr:hypothetical protein [Planomonospora venezuelensis]MBB5962536.1 hypothetical protein [Planomonospora venezuelensis]GIM99059.1 hypothetical protein Pve01_07180 [Planomonospora venezuelensis]